MLVYNVLTAEHVRKVYPRVRKGWVSAAEFTMAKAGGVPKESLRSINMGVT
jgi:hypothetical protein